MASAEEAAARQTRQSLWTAWCDAFSTGEGRSVMACITYAHDEPGIRQIFAEKFGQWYAPQCDAQRGVVHNECTKLLWSLEALELIERVGFHGGLVDVRSELHFNLG